MEWRCPPLEQLIESNASLTEFNKYINSYQFEYIYVTHRDLYDRLVSYRNNLIVETAKIVLESFTKKNSIDNSKDKKYSKNGINDSWKETQDEFGGGSFGIKLVKSHWYCIAKNQWYKWNCDAYNV